MEFFGWSASYCSGANSLPAGSGVLSKSQQCVVLAKLVWNLFFGIGWGRGAAREVALGRIAIDEPGYLGS